MKNVKFFRTSEWLTNIHPKPATTQTVLRVSKFFIKRAALVKQTEAHVVLRLLRLFLLFLFLLLLFGCNANRKQVHNQWISVFDSNTCGSIWRRARGYLVRLHLQEQQQQHQQRPERLHHRLQRYRSDCRCPRWPEPEHRKWHQTSRQHSKLRIKMHYNMNVQASQTSASVSIVDWEINAP